jgi:putative transposase
VSKRLSPAQRLREEIDGVFAGGEDLAGAIEQVAALGARLLLQAAIEAEVSAFLGRDRYQRAAASEDARAGIRNGYCPTTVKTTVGPVTLERPKVRGTTERFASQLFGKGVTKTNAVESLVIAGFVRGLSTRAVEATLVESLGEAAAVSKSTVSRICEDIRRSRIGFRSGRVRCYAPYICSTGSSSLPGRWAHSGRRTRLVGHRSVRRGVGRSRFCRVGVKAGPVAFADLGVHPGGDLGKYVAQSVDLMRSSA